MWYFWRIAPNKDKIKYGNTPPSQIGNKTLTQVEQNDITIQEIQHAQLKFYSEVINLQEGEPQYVKSIKNTMLKNEMGEGDYS